MKRKISLLWFCVLITIAGCSIFSNGDDKMEQTYPPAFDFKIVTIKQLEQLKYNSFSSKKGSAFVNIHAYVVNRTVAPDSCPYFAVCVGNNIYVSDSTQVAYGEAFPIYDVKNPLQFKKEEHYVLSVNVFRVDTLSSTHVKLLGYTLLKAKD